MTKIQEMTTACTGKKTVLYRILKGICRCKVCSCCTCIDEKYQEYVACAVDHTSLLKDTVFPVFIAGYNFTDNC